MVLLLVRIRKQREGDLSMEALFVPTLSTPFHERTTTVHESILEAIQNGNWDYEPNRVNESEFSATAALPGTHEKLDILAHRIEQGLPLWHSQDRISYEDGE